MYSDKEMILWSLIYSKTKSTGKFEFFKISPTKLFKIFKESCNQNLNLFKLSFSQKEKFFKRIDIEITQNIFDIFFEDSDRLNVQLTKEIELIKNHKINYITYFSYTYPLSLKNSSLPPFVIYYKGCLPKDSEIEKSIAIIGTRTPKEKDIENFTEKLLLNLKDRIIYNVSGLAEGCDEIGHRISLKLGIKNIAVLGQGLTTSIYPQNNISIYKQILENNGIVLSEIPPSISAKPIYLLYRNRLQVYFSKEIIVLETGIKGGTIQTLKFAFKEKRKIYFRNTTTHNSLFGKIYKNKVKFIDENFIPHTKELKLF